MVFQQFPYVLIPSITLITIYPDLRYRFELKMLGLESHASGNKAFRHVETLYQLRVSKPCYWLAGFVYLLLAKSRVCLPFGNQ